MFDIGAPELFIVAVLAIIVVGPKDLPKLIRSLMGMVRKVREMGREFQDGVKKMADEVELDSVTRKLNEAAKISLDDVASPKPEANEFDYDDYDYENQKYVKPADKDAASAKEKNKPSDTEKSSDLETVDKVIDKPIRSPEKSGVKLAKADAPRPVKPSKTKPKPKAKKAKKKIDD
jgi:sec-independent protein translocase protein TatB